MSGIDQDCLDEIRPSILMIIYRMGYYSFLYLLILVCVMFALLFLVVSKQFIEKKRDKYSIQWPLGTDTRTNSKLMED